MLVANTARLVAVVAALGISACGSQAAKTVTVTSPSTTSAPATTAATSATTITTGGLSPQLNAALAFNAAYSRLHDAIARVTKGITGAATPAQVAALYTAEVKLRSHFDTNISNIDFPASDRNDVKALLVADTAVEDAESMIAGDESAAETASLSHDDSVVQSALNKFDAALTAVQYDVGDA
jgi:hypothetical protein